MTADQIMIPGEEEMIKYRIIEQKFIDKPSVYFIQEKRRTILWFPRLWFDVEIPGYSIGLPSFERAEEELRKYHNQRKVSGKMVRLEITTDGFTKI